MKKDIRINPKYLIFQIITMNFSLNLIKPYLLHHEQDEYKRNKSSIQTDWTGFWKETHSNKIYDRKKNFWVERRWIRTTLVSTTLSSNFLLDALCRYFVRVFVFYVIHIYYRAIRVSLRGSCTLFFVLAVVVDFFIILNLLLN